MSRIRAFLIKLLVGNRTVAMNFEIKEGMLVTSSTGAFIRNVNVATDKARSAEDNNTVVEE